MGSIHFWAVTPEEKLAEGPWFEHRGSRALTERERREIGELSSELEERTYAWLGEMNESGEWKEYYSDRFHRWLERVRERDGEKMEPANDLYLHLGGEELYCTGIEVSDSIFFGFLNLDDVECDFNIVRFLREYVRRLSIIMPDLIWIFDHHDEAYYGGVPVTIKRKGIKNPNRTATRRDRIPRHVKEILGAVEMPPPKTCQFCRKADRRVTPQYLNGLIHAHERCFLDFYRHAHELDMV